MSIRKPVRVDVSTHTVGLSAQFDASLVPEQHDPPIPVDGVTFGVADMSENSPHGGEMHPDGDETLYLVSGHARVVFIDSPEPDVDMHAGDALVVPRGVWHRVDILEPCRIVYLTPGPNNQFLPLPE